MIFAGLTITLFIIFLVMFGSFQQDDPKYKRGKTRTVPSMEPTPGEEEEFVIDEGQGAGKQFRFLQQCFLVDKIFQIAEDSIHRQHRFKNFSLVTGRLPEVNGRLLGKNNAAPLFELSEKQIGGLVPYLKLYKSVGDDPERKWLEIPFAKWMSVRRAAPFGAPFLGDNIFAGFDGSACGIKSFSYTLAGTNPDEAQKVLTAKLQLWFQTLSDLFVSSTYTTAGTFDAEGNVPDFVTRPVDLIMYTNPKHGGSKPGKVSQEYNFKKFQFKAVAGWAMPPSEEGSANPVYDKKTREAIEESRVHLFLQLQNHELSIGQDGTVRLDIEYIATPEADFDRPLMNVLWLEEDNQEAQLRAWLGQLQGQGKKYEKVIKTLNKIHTALKHKESTIEGLSTEAARESAIAAEFYEQFGLGNAGVHPDHANLGALTKAQQADLLAFIVAEQNRIDKGVTGAGGWRLGRPPKAYDIIISDILNAGLPGHMDKDVHLGTIWNHDLLQTIEEDIATKELAVERQDLKADQRIAQIRRRAQIKRVARYDTIFQWLLHNGRVRRIWVQRWQLGITEEGVPTTAASLKNFGDDPIEIEWVAPASDPGTNTTFYDVVNSQIEESEEIEEQQDQIVGGADLDTEFNPKGSVGEEAESAGIPVYFVTFGDLVDAVIGIVASNPNADSALFTDYGVLSGPISLDRVRHLGDEERYILNMAHLPVSLDYFLLWFQQHIILEQRDIYPLKDFILDMAKDLVRKALGESCLNEKKQDINTKVAFVQQETKNIKLRGGRCNLKNLPGGTFNSSREKLKHYFYFYSLEQRPVVDESKRKENFDNGIYHFEVGATKGLLKNITFARQDIPGLREHRITGDTTNKTGFLREKYDFNLGMVGNTLFNPGQYVYLNPRLPGASRKQAENLGLGGVHFVNEVFHMIEDQYYQTEIKAVHQNFSQEYKDVPTKVLLDGHPCGGDSSALSLVTVADEVGILDARIRAVAAKEEKEKRLYYARLACKINGTCEALRLILGTDAVQDWMNKIGLGGKIKF